MIGLGRCGSVKPIPLNIRGGRGGARPGGGGAGGGGALRTVGERRGVALAGVDGLVVWQRRAWLVGGRGVGHRAPSRRSCGGHPSVGERPWLATTSVRRSAKFAPCDRLLGPSRGMPADSRHGVLTRQVRPASPRI